MDFNSFSEIGIINQQQIDSNPAIDYKEFKSEVSKFLKINLKEGIVSLFESIVPEFKHLEKDKSLEQKCKMIRFFDIIFSITALIFFAPIFLIIIIILKVTGRVKFFIFKKELV